MSAGSTDRSTPSSTEPVSAEPVSTEPASTQRPTGQPIALVLRALYLGDMITALPALRLLRSALPTHRIVLAAPATAGSLALLAGVVDDLTPALELAELVDAPRGTDVAVDLHGNGPGSRDLLARTEPRRIVSYYGGAHVWKAGEHEVARWCRLVQEAFAGAVAPWPALAGCLPVPVGVAAVPAGLTILHPGAKARSRQWPPDRYVAVARRLTALGHRVVVTGGPGEEQLAGTTAARAGVQALTALSLPQLLALVARARLVICGDTGIAHVASVYSTPSVVLFGPVSPVQWGPPPDGPHCALWPAAPDYRGDPHADVTDPVLLRTSVEDVLDAVAVVDAAGQAVHSGS